MTKNDKTVSKAKKKLDISKLVKKSDKWNEWKDWLRLKLEWENIFLEKYIKMCDLDNSNFATIYFKDSDITVIKVQTKTWIGLVGTTSYRGSAIPVFYYEKYDDHTKDFSWCYWKFDLYGSFFRLSSIKRIFEVNESFENIEFKIFEENEDSKKVLFYEFVKNNFWLCKITRCDYRFDFLYINKLNEKGEKIKQKIFLPSELSKVKSNSKIEYKTTANRIDSWRLWERKNKNYVIRWYDKLLDSWKKWKFALYADYFDYDDVFRLEYEFLNHFCKGFYFYDIDKLQIKIDIFFKTGNLSKEKNYTTKEKIKLDDITSRFKYARSCKWYMKWCIENNINIFWLLDEVFDEIGIKENSIKDIYNEYIQKKEDFEFYYEDWKSGN